MKRLRVGFVLALVLMVALIALAPSVASAAGSQQWILDNDMTMDVGGSHSGFIDIDAGDEVIWIATDAAAVDVTFPSGTWVVQLKTDTDWGDNGDACGVEVGEWDGSVFIPMGATIGTQIFFDGHLLEVLVQSGSFTVQEDNYLALRVANNNGSTHRVHTIGKSWLTSPKTDPGYPMPETSALLLLGGGLIGLVGFMGVRRFRATTAKA